MSDKRVTVKIGEDQYTKVQKKSELTKIPQIHIINKAIDKYFDDDNIMKQRRF